MFLDCVYRVTTVGNTECLRTSKVVFSTTSTDSLCIGDTVSNKA